MTQPVVTNPLLTSSKRGELLQVLGVTFGIAVAIGAMIGVGILRAPSLIARDVPNSWLILGLWFVALLHAFLEANVISELATSMPRAGGPYVYVHRAFGEIGGLAVGWTLWVQRVASTAALSIAFAEFAVQIVPALAPATAAIAVAMQLAMFGLNIAGVREGRTIQEITSFLKALALLGFCAAVYLVMAPHGSAMPRITAIAGWGAIIAAYQSIVGAYSGWYEPAFFSEETPDAARNLPRVIAISLLLTAVLYIGINAALLRMLSPAEIARFPLPFAAALSGGRLTVVAVAIFAMVSAASCANAGIMSAPRVLLALSRDGLLPAFFRNVNMGGSPSAATLFTAAAAIAVALTGSFSLAFGLIATLQSASFVLVISALFVLRRREPELVRPFRAIFYPWAPLLVLGVDLALLGLFLNANRTGGIYAILFWLLAIPFAIVARRARDASAPVPTMRH
ncbi:MAG TPA: APC family permease [Rhizomicrobium sp.]|jgi:APA family basic amino acid/polyamine antiporter|nr:APC family permease [Rhizomicrobium sp.]